jgi:ABC-2 type transport system ATP-binding protein
VLEGHPSVERVETKDGRLLVTLNADVSDYSDLPGLLIQHGYKLMLFKEDELNLETAFMALTKGITA